MLYQSDIIESSEVKAYMYMDQEYNDFLTVLMPLI